MKKAQLLMALASGIFFSAVIYSNWKSPGRTKPQSVQHVADSMEVIELLPEPPELPESNE